MPESERSGSVEEFWLWSCNNEGCYMKGGEVFDPPADEEPPCPRCGGEMQRHIDFIRADSVTTLNQRVEELTRELEANSDGWGTCARQLQEAEDRVAELEAALAQLVDRSTESVMTPNHQRRFSQAVEKGRSALSQQDSNG